ncbi:hypothetical protein EDC04DRAFT_2694758, partial [Pisolithus marmoratus]
MLTYDLECRTRTCTHKTCLFVSIYKLCTLLSNFPSERSKNSSVDHSWDLPHKNHVWVVGYLEWADDQLPIPILLVYLPAPDINPSMFMRAWITSPAKDFDVMRLRTALMGHGDGG